jgi:arylsulfatase A-like enzyme
MGVDRVCDISGPLLLLALFVLACSEPVPQPRPNVVLIVMDTTRADHLSLYGYDRDTTPHLASFAGEAILFDHAYATSPWTVSSHASLFTGLLPVTHQATQENLRLDSELETLAELLGRAGYETAAFTNNMWISKVTDLSRGFDEVAALWRTKGEAEGDGGRHATNRAVLRWLSERDQDRPFFVFINYMEPHWPFRAPKAYRDRFLSGVDASLVKRSRFSAVRWYHQKGRRAPDEVLAARVGLYDTALAVLDDVLNDLLGALREVVSFDDTLIIVTADHGENLGDHGHMGHSFALYDSTLRIPLLIRRPGRKESGTVRTDPVQLTDLFVTIAKAADIGPLDERVTGVDLMADSAPADRPIVGEYYYPGTFLGRFPKTRAAEEAIAPFKRRIRSIQIGPDKLIWGSDGRNELYRTAVDPHETDNRIDRDPERARLLEAKLDEIVEQLSRSITVPQPPISEMDPEVISELRALGYIP